MKKSVWLLLSFFVFSVCVADSVFAQQKKSALDKDDMQVLANIAVLDVITVRRNAKAFKDLRRQINELREQLKKDARAEDTELQKANRELARQRAILTPEAFSEERKKFEKRVGDVQQNFQNRWKSLKEIERKAEAKILEVMQKATVEVAQKRGLILLFRKRSIVFWVESLEVTKDIIEILDKKLPKVELDIPKDFVPASAGKQSSGKK